MGTQLQQRVTNFYKDVFHHGAEGITIHQDTEARKAYQEGVKAQGLTPASRSTQPDAPADRQRSVWCLLELTGSHGGGE